MSHKGSCIEKLISKCMLNKNNITDILRKKAVLKLKIFALFIQIARWKCLFWNFKFTGIFSLWILSLLFKFSLPLLLKFKKSLCYCLVHSKASWRFLLMVYILSLFLFGFTEYFFYVINPRDFVLLLKLSSTRHFLVFNKTV